MCCGCDTSYNYSVGPHPVSSLHKHPLLCPGHSWRVRLAKQETLTPPGHLVSPLVNRGPWMSIVVLYCWCHSDSDSASVILYFTFCILTEKETDILKLPQIREKNEFNFLCLACYTIYGQLQKKYSQVPRITHLIYGRLRWTSIFSFTYIPGRLFFASISNARLLNIAQFFKSHDMVSEAISNTFWQ